MKQIFLSIVLFIFLFAGHATAISLEYRNIPVIFELTVAEKSGQTDANTPVKEDEGNRVENKSSDSVAKKTVYGDRRKKKTSAVKLSLGRDELIALEAGLHRHAWEIGSEVYHFRYVEPHIMKDEGLFYGATVGYTYRGWVPASEGESLSADKGLVRFEGRFASGQVDYEGALSDETPYSINNVDDYAMETRLLLGIEELDDDWLASLYFGIGYRYLNDDTSFDRYGYERESNYLYVPLGYQLDGGIRNNWSWGCRLETDFLIQGTQKSHLSDVGYRDVENHQRNGYGLRASLKLRNYGDRGIFIFEPFIRYWSIDESDPSYAGYGLFGVEPENKTTEYGIQLVWMF